MTEDSGLPPLVAEMAQARLSCATRAAGLTLARLGAAADANLADALAALAEQGHADPCWQTQAAARALAAVLSAR